MKLLFVADGRSPIALNWIRHFIRAGDEVHLVSTFPADPLPGLASFNLVPVAFSQAAGKPGSWRGALLKRLVTPQVRNFIRQWFGVTTLRRAALRLGAHIAAIEPDLVHAMRVPYEGMAAALAMRSGAGRFPPLLISIWGNDFTLHAAANAGMARLTRFTMQSASAVHADCLRDIRLAHSWGFPAEAPSIVLPGGGGVQPDLFFPPEPPSPDSTRALTIIQPRGVRAYVHNDAFFQAIPGVLARHPGIRFLCVGMQGDPAAESAVDQLEIAHAVTLLPTLDRPAMAERFREAAIMVSPTSHDGTPNTFLEALACGCFPVVGDIESLREWITHQENGLLVDPRDPDSIAEGLIAALDNPDLRRRAREQNLRLVRERADHGMVMKAAEAFYASLVSGLPAGPRPPASGG